MGFGPKTAALTRPVGWENDSFGYHGDDGNVYIGNQNAKHYGPGYTTNDIVGCGINFLNKTIFFTRNGVNLGEQTWGEKHQSPAKTSWLTHIYYKARLPRTLKVNCIPLLA